MERARTSLERVAIHKPNACIPVSLTEIDNTKREIPSSENITRTEATKVTPESISCTKGNEKVGDDESKPKARDMPVVSVNPTLAVDNQPVTVATSDHKRSWARLQQYDGSSSLSIFLGQIEAFAKYQNWKDMDKLMNIQLLLTGSAAQIVGEGHTFSNSDDLIKKLHERFGTEGRQQMFQAQLKSLNSNGQLSASQIFNEVNRLMPLAFEKPSDATGNALSVGYYVDAIKDPVMKFHLLDRNFKDLTSVNSAALVYESNRLAISNAQAMQPDRNRFDTRVRTVKADLSDDDDIDGSKKHSSDGHVNLRAENSLLREELRKCRENQERIERNDFIRRENTNKSITGHSTQQNEKREFVCYNCGESGHFARNCKRIKKRYYPDKNDKVKVNALSADLEKEDNSVIVRLITVTDVYSRDIMSAVYLIGKYENVYQVCLIDSGSDISVIGLSLISPDQVLDTTRAVSTVNGIPLAVSGKANINIDIDGEMTEDVMIVSPDVDYVLLGMKWLSRYISVWDISRRFVKIHGVQIDMLSKRDAIVICGYLNKTRNIAGSICSIIDTEIKPVTGHVPSELTTVAPVQTSDGNASTAYLACDASYRSESDCITSVSRDIVEPVEIVHNNKPLSSCFIAPALGGYLFNCTDNSIKTELIDREEAVNKYNPNLYLLAEV
ncbi:MAG: hypothetical protein ACSLE2_11050, partial [Lysobacterales bacterium]